MDPTSPDGERKEQRILAAIVFTDVVGFSKLAAANEARVYASLQRDMGVISNLCRNYSGQVLNTMGDGMLLCFTSAVDAMSCALEIQQALYAQAQSLPASDILHHRIGVHLGDIIMSGDNVFGDGVNTAARLQAEAKPDAICFSKTVHEVVKNKIKLKAEYLAPRQLKNVGKVDIWQIPPIEEARQRAVEAMVSAPLQADKESSGAIGSRALGLVCATVLCIGAIGFFMKNAASRMPSIAKPGSVFQDKNSPLKSLVKGTLDRGQSLADSPAGNSHITENPSGSRSVPTTAEITEKYEALKTAMDFDKIVTFLQGEGKDLPDAATLAITFSDLSQMRHWVDSEVNVATNSNPISLTLNINNAQTPVTVYRGTAEGLYSLIQNGSGQIQPVSFDDLGEAGIEAIVQSLIDHPITQPQANAANWLIEFQKQYR